MPKESLISVLGREEAQSVNLSLRAFKAEVESIFAGDNRIVVVAFDKQQPDLVVGLSIFKLKDIHSSRVFSFPLEKTVNFAALTNRNRYHEVAYCIRSPTFRGKCVGSICLAAGLEVVRQSSVEENYTANIWLVVSGSFQNPRAVRLYMDYGFIVQGTYEKEVSLVMMIKDFDHSKYEKTLATLQRYAA